MRGRNVYVSLSIVGVVVAGGGSNLVILDLKARCLLSVIFV